MFSVGDLIAHPLHGAGKIDEIRSRRISGITRIYYVLHIPIGDMTVLIPVDSAETIGVRPLVSESVAMDVIAAIPNIHTQITQNWNQRYRENMMKIKTGNLYEVAGVIKSLMQRDLEKNLSTGERRMLHTARQILISELVLTLGISESEAEKLIDDAVKL